MDPLFELGRWLAERLGERVERDAPLGALTTYRVGGRAALRVEAGSTEDLAVLAEGLAEVAPVPVLTVGRGSNLLVSDRGFAGVVVVLGEGYDTVAVDDDLVRAGGRASLPVLARRSAAAGLTGLEWAVGVPGSVGGAVRMNAGGHGSDTAATLVSVEGWDLARGAPFTWGRDELAPGYRTSAVGSRHVVLAATHRLAEGDPARGAAEIASIVRWRRAHQPGGSNAGSVFTNPPDDSAGRLVEAAGMKGARLGTASVSTKHANFILADDGGSAEDVVGLMATVRRVVAEREGVLLRSEIRLVGFDAVLLEQVGGEAEP